MMSVLELRGTVSRIRAMACMMINIGVKSVAEDVRLVLPCCLFVCQGTSLIDSLQMNQINRSEGRKEGRHTSDRSAPTIPLCQPRRRPFHSPYMHRPNTRYRWWYSWERQPEEAEPALAWE